MQGGISENIGGKWTLKYEISSPRFYELLIKTELKGDTALDLQEFFNHIKIYLSAVNRLREDLLPYYHFIKRNSKFKEFLSHIAITLPSPGISRYTLPLDTHS